MTHTCNCKEMSCPKDCTKNHTHKGFFCEVCNPVHTDQFEGKIIETSERITIDYATLSGRETEHRAEFRNRVTEHLTSLVHHIREETEREMMGKVKEFRHEHRDKHVSTEFDIAFDEFLSNLESDTTPKQ